MGSLEKVRELAKYGLPTPLAQHLIHELDRVTKTRGAHYKLLAISNGCVNMIHGCVPEPRAIIIRICGENVYVIDREYTGRTYNLPLSLFPVLRLYIELLRVSNYNEKEAVRRFLACYGSTG